MKDFTARKWNEGEENNTFKKEFMSIGSRLSMSSDSTFPNMLIWRYRSTPTGRCLSWDPRIQSNVWELLKTFRCTHRTITKTWTSVAMHQPLFILYWAFLRNFQWLTTLFTYRIVRDLELTFPLTRSLKFFILLLLKVTYSRKCLKILRMFIKKLNFAWFHSVWLFDSCLAFNLPHAGCIQGKLINWCVLLHVCNALKANRCNKRWRNREENSACSRGP